MKKKLICDTIQYGVKTKTWKIMRLSAFFLFLFLSQVWAGAGYSQQTKLSLKMKDARIIEILDKIEDNSEFYFLFNQKLIDVDRKVDVDVNKKTVNEILDQLFEDTQVAYLVKDRQIVLTTYNATESISQQKSISGKVTDENGESLPGVTVLIKGTTNGTVTNFDGEFTISNIPDNATLQFSFVGMLTQEMEVGSITTINVIMVPDAIGVDEVVVVGYGTQKKVNLTGAVDQISAKTLSSRSVTKVSNALQGLSPGMVVTSTNGAPGASSSIKIRGNTSVNGNPLLVLIDGVEGNMDAINPDDIENISILKDAASASIYGSRAAGGVILITTKAAKNGKLSVSYNNNFAVRTPTRMPSSNSGLDHALLWNAAYETQGKIGYSDTHIEAIKDPNVSVIPVVPGESVSFSSLDGWLHASSTDWLGMMFDQSTSQTHNFSIAKAGDVNYRLSVGYVKDNGFFEQWGPDSYKRMNARFNVSTDLIKDRLNIDTKISYANEDRAGNYVDVRNIYRTPSTMPVKDTNDNFLRYRMQGNPIQELETGGEKSTITHRFDGNVKLSLIIMDGLEFTSLNGARLVFSQVDNFRNPRAKWKSDGTLRAALNPKHYTVNRQATEYNYLSTQNYLTYNKTFAEKHAIKAMVGQSAESGRNNSLSAYRPEIVGANAVPALNLGNADDATNSNSLSEWALYSYFGRLNYAYDNKYLFEANFRADASSKFSDKHRRGFFPSFSVGWRVSEENFLKDSDIFQNLKVRASWGQLGNQSGLGYYDHIPVYSFGGTYPMDGSIVQWATQTQLASVDRTWETIESTNLGVDFSVFDSRLNFTVEYFTKKNKDMLISAAVPEVIGIAVPTGNYGELEVKGWEVMVGWNDKTDNGFSYGVNFNISDQNDELVKYNITEISKGVGRNVQGYSMYSVFGYQTDGYFASQEEVDAHPFINTNTAPGDIKYINQDDDDKISSPGDIVYLGETAPHYVMGLSMNGEYKGFDLNLLFQGVGKKLTSINQEWSDPNLIYPTQNGWDNYSFTYQNDYWTSDNTDARFPRPTVSKGGYNYWVSDHWMEKGAYVRLKSFQLGYTLPKGIIKQIGIDNLRIYVSGENLFEFTNLLDAFDPEIGNGRSGASIYPLKRTYSMGLNLSF